MISLFRQQAPGTLERRMALILTAVCVAMVAALAWLEWTAQRNVLETARRANANLASSVADHAAQVLRRADDAVGTLAAFGSRPEADVTRDASVREMLLRQVGTGGVLTDLCLYDAAGRLILSSYVDRRYERSALGHDFFAHHQASARDAAYVGAPFRSEWDGGWVIPLSRRVSDADGAFLGVAVALVDTRPLIEYLTQFDTGRLGSVALVSASGIVLARHPGVESVGSSGIRVADSPLYRDHLSVAKQGALALRSVLDGVEREVSFERSRSYGVTAVVGTAHDEVLAHWRAGALRTAVACAGLLLVLGGLSRRVLKAQRRQRELVEQLAHSNRHLADLERAVREHAVVAVTDVSGTILSVNDKFCELSQFREDELIGRNHRVLNSGLHAPEFFRDMWRTIAQGGVWKGLITNRRKDGSLYHVDSTIVPIRRADGRPERYIAVRTDVTELRMLAHELGMAKQNLERANVELEQQAATDPLTWLANRRRFDRALEDELKRAQRDGLHLSLLMVDVDRFKLFNDGYGHQAGDTCLRQVATALKLAEGRPGDLAGRWGGEEFAVLLPATDGPGAMVVAERVRQAVANLKIAHRHNESGVVTVSIGIASLDWSVPFQRVEALVEAADRALYRAKEGGRNRCILGRLGAPPDATSPQVAEKLTH